MPLTVTLPEDLAEAVRVRMARGDYASEEEVLRHGLELLAGQDGALERWLREEVVPGVEAWRADPRGGATAEDILRGLRDGRFP